MGAPACERYSASSGGFIPVDAPAALAGRTGHSATLLPDGRVLLAGGVDPQGAPLDTLVVVSPAPLTVAESAARLPAARSRHAAFLDGGELVLCGGTGAGGVPVATCDALDLQTLAPSRASSPLPTPRSGMSVVPIDTGDLLLVGGADGNGNPSGAIELYTPLN
jgi:hypothetical protein